MTRPENFDDIIGHSWLITYLKNAITKHTLPNFLILDGAEGLGKTSIADIIALDLVYGSRNSKEREEAYTNVVCGNQSNTYIKHYKLSIEGGKDVAKEVLSEMKSTFTLNRPKVIICDECHGLSDAAQDVFLADTEFINSNVYMIMLTTEVTKLKASLRSRAVSFHLEPLKHSDMIALLQREVEQRSLLLSNQQAILTMIAEWAENRPRTGLNVLKAFSAGDVVSAETIRSMIGYLDVKDVIPLIASLAGSMTFGLSYISDMRINPTLISIVTECIKVKHGIPSYKLSMNDALWVKTQIAEVSEDQLVRFLFGLTRHSKLTRSAVVNAYIGAHNSFSNITKSDTSNMLQQEVAQLAKVTPELDIRSTNKAPTLDDLMLESEVIT